jgi:hypothetical protein
MNARVSRLSVGRLVNLGNYEHIRYEVTVEIPEGVDVTTTLTTVEKGLNMLAERPPSGAYYGIHHAREVIAKADKGEPLGEMDRQNLGTFRETVKRYDAWGARQQYARALLGDFSLSSEFTDAKEKWEDDQ